MKTVLFSFLVFFFCLSSLHAQLAGRVGINFSNVSFSEENVDFGGRTGIQAGLTYTARLGDNLSIRPGALISIKGFNDALERGNLSYLEVPLSFLFHIIGNQSKIYLEAGPYVGALIESNQDIDYNALDLGLNIGAGITLGRLGVGATYGIGLGNIIDGSTITTDETARNRNLALFAAVAF